MPRAKKLSDSDVIRSELRLLSDPEKAKTLLRFFKTGSGEYGEGDQFLGVVAPSVRKVVKSHRDAGEMDVLKLLRSEYHEERLTALLILVEQYQRGDDRRRKLIYDLYLANTRYVNNWDLVDLTAPHIVGAHLFGKRSSVLSRLARSSSLWERRIAILATFYFIRQGECSETLRIAEILLHDSHDLIHKAVGWMLRVVGKRCSIETECRFLDAFAAEMPRTMLRYSIERFPGRLKSRYMNTPRRRR